MACHYPKPAYLSTEGKVTFTRREKALGNTAFIHIRCGMCIGCKADHARDWSIRCYHEAQSHNRNCFLTLTYDQAHLPPHGSLQKTDLQRFWRYLRKRGIYFRYFACGEYGEKKGRPHYHAVMFGYRPEEKTLRRLSKKGHPQYVSKIFSECWIHGEVTWSEFDPSAASYVASYTADKLKSFAASTPDPETGLRAYEIMDRDGVIWNLQPEFQLQSLKPAIGLRWLERNWREVFPADSVAMGGKEYPPPRFYYKWLKDHHQDTYQVVQANRKKKSREVPYETGLRMDQMAQAKGLKLRRKLSRPLHNKEN